MARSRRRRPDPRPPDDDALARLIAGWKRTETRRGATWTVQPVTGRRAEKTYTCPGCGGPIDPGTSHLVVWRADGILGDAADLAARRHWHSHCWKVY